MSGLGKTRKALIFWACWTPSEIAIAAFTAREVSPESVLLLHRHAINEVVLVTQSHH